MAVFHWITPVQKTPSAYGSWVDVDVSADVPADATGVIVRFTGITNTVAIGLRPKGSTDDRRAYGLYLGSQTHGIMKLDANRVFQVFVATSVGAVYVLGYTHDIVWNSGLNATQFSFPQLAAWVDLDFSGHIPEPAAFVVLEQYKADSSLTNLGFRMNGSTDQRGENTASHQSGWFLQPVDENGICEGAIWNVNQTIWVWGYIPRNSKTATRFKWNTNAVQQTPGGNGSYYDAPAVADALAINSFYEITNGNSDQKWALRPNGATWDYYATLCRHTFAVPVGLDASQLCEYETDSNTLEKFFWQGYEASFAINLSQATPGTVKVSWG